MVNALGKKLLTGPAFTGDQHWVGVGGRHQCLLFQFGKSTTVADNAFQGISGGTQRHQFFFVLFDLRFEMAQFLGQFHHLPHILKHDQAENGDDRSRPFNGNAVNKDVLAPDGLGLVDFRFACAGHNVHPGVFHDVGAVFSDAIARIDAEKLRIGFVQMGDDAVGIRNHGPVEYVVEKQVKQLQLFFDGLKIRAVGYVLIARHLTVNL